MVAPSRLLEGCRIDNAWSGLSTTRAYGDSCRKPKAHRATKIVDEQVKPVEVEYVDRGYGKPAQSSPGVIKVSRTIGEATTG
ncbi:MAG: hypothetical protein GY788_19600 [bacterium]|nr:hypothetical protein [bacterium]